MRQYPQIDPVAIAIGPVMNKAWTLLFVLLFLSLQANAGAAAPFAGDNQRDDSLGGFLPVEEAFKAEAWRDEERLFVRFRNAENYYLHRHRFGVESRDSAVSFGELDLPPGEPIEHEALGEMRVYYDEVVFTALIEAEKTDTAPIAITVMYQGCTDDGLCYAPAQVELEAFFGSPPA